MKATGLLRAGILSLALAGASAAESPGAAATDAARTPDAEVVGAEAARAEAAGVEVAGAAATGAEAAGRSVAAAVEPSPGSPQPLPGSGELSALTGDGAMEGLEPEPYTYRSGSRRDPFAPLVKPAQGEVEADENRMPGVGDLTLTGIVWGSLTRIALAETFWGAGLILHEGDKLRDGRVVRITPEGVTLRQNGFGASRTITLTIGTAEETGHER